MDTAIIWGVIVTGIGSLFAWVLKHTADSDRHPKKSDVVFRDVCKSERDRIKESFGYLGERIAEMKDDHSKRFDELKKDHSNRFDQLEELIRKNGKQT